MQQFIRFISKTSVLLLLGIICIIVFFIDTYKDGQSQVVSPLVMTDSITPSMSLPQSTSSKQLNLSGSYACESESSVAYISNKKLYFETKTATSSSHISFQGDCLYMWQKNVKTGQKTCGLGQYVRLFEMVKGTNLDLKSISGFLGNNGVVSKFLGGQSVSGLDASLLSSCHEEPVDAQIFQLPSDVTFVKTQNK